MSLHLPKRINQKQAQRIISSVYSQQRRTIFARNPRNPLMWRCIINGRPFEAKSILGILVQDEPIRYSMAREYDARARGKAKHEAAFGKKAA